MTIKTRTPADKAEPVAETPKRKTLSRARKPSAEQVAAEKSEVPVVNDTPAQGIGLEGLDRPVTGRGVFAVRTLGTAVSVESAFLEEGGNVLRLPAVFPNRDYAMQQIDELRQIVNQHFDDVDKAAN